MVYSAKSMAAKDVISAECKCGFYSDQIDHSAAYILACYLNESADKRHLLDWSLPAAHECESACRGYNALIPRAPLDCHLAPFNQLTRFIFFPTQPAHLLKSLFFPSPTHIALYLFLLLAPFQNKKRPTVNCAIWLPIGWLLMLSPWSSACKILLSAPPHCARAVRDCFLSNGEPRVLCCF